MTSDKKEYVLSVLIPALDGIVSLYELGMTQKEVMATAMDRLNGVQKECEVTADELAELWHEIIEKYESERQTSRN